MKNEKLTREENFQTSYLLILLGLPAGVIATIAGAVAAISYFTEDFTYRLLGFFLILLGAGFLYLFAKSDQREKPSEQGKEEMYVTDWKGNSVFRDKALFLPFSDIFFTVRDFKIGERTLKEVRSAGITDLNMTTSWRPDRENIHDFMETDERNIPQVLLDDFVGHLVSKNGATHLYAKSESSRERIVYESLGIVVNYRAAERVEPLITRENEEKWFEYNAYQIAVLNNEPVFLSEDDAAAHVHIIGASRFGKSKLIEHIARQIIYYRKFGLCVIDPNQQLYDDLLTWCVHRRYVKGDIHFLDPSDEKSTIGFNPFRLNGIATPERISARASRLLKTTLKAFGIQGDSAIQAQRIIRCLYYFIIEQNLPITELKAFVTPRLFERRDEIVSRCKSEDIRDQWEMLTLGKTDAAYIAMMQSSANRLFEFISEGGVQKLFTNPHQLNFADITRKGECVIINLGKSDFIKPEIRKVIGTFLVDEVWEVMSSRNREEVAKIPQFQFMVDEFHNFATPEFAEMLKEGAKYRLHLWLINHVLSDLDRDVRDALSACHLKMAFGKTSQQDASSVLEGSYARVGHNLKEDAEVIPRLPPRQFMLIRTQQNNVICETPEVSFHDDGKLSKEMFLDMLTREPGAIIQPSSSQTRTTPKIQEPKGNEQNSKKKEIPPDEFYF